MNIKLLLRNNERSTLLLTRIISYILFCVFINRVIRKGNRNKIENRGSLLYGVKFELKGNNNRVFFDGLSRFKNVKFTIIGDFNTIRIGEHCTINDSEFWVEDDANIIELKNKIRFNGCHLAATEGKYIKVGNDCLFSRGIDIRTGDSHSIIHSITKERLNPAKSIVVGDHVWVGKNVTILKGVNVASNSIIGTGSLVVNDVAQNTLVAGSPAKMLKDNIDWVIERI